MRDLIKVEIFKLLKSRMFIGVLIIGTCLATWSSLTMIATYYSDLGVYGIIRRMEETGNVSDIYIGMLTLYNCWSGGDWRTLGISIFFTISPILACFPCGWTFSEELHGGYLRIIGPKTGRKLYFNSKVITSFISGGVIVIIPQIVSLLTVALFIPAIQPNPLYNMYFGIVHGCAFSNLFYGHPLCCCIVVLIFDFVYGGLFALLSLETAFFVKSRTKTVIIPFIVLALCGMGQTLLIYISNYSISPLEMLHPLTANNMVSLWAMIIWCIALVTFSIPVIAIKGYRREII